MKLLWCYTDFFNSLKGLKVCFTWFYNELLYKKKKHGKYMLKVSSFLIEEVSCFPKKSKCPNKF